MGRLCYIAPVPSVRFFFGYFWFFFGASGGQGA